MDLNPSFLISCPNIALLWQITVQNSIFNLLISLN
jgi:hypothetical protein